MKYEADFETHVCGIPCGVVVERFIDVPPNPNSWDSPDDYYGYIEIEWFLIDRKGYKANWLRNKMSKDDVDKLENEIVDEKENECY